MLVLTHRIALFAIFIRISGFMASIYFVDLVHDSKSFMRRFVAVRNPRIDSWCSNSMVDISSVTNDCAARLR